MKEAITVSALNRYAKALIESDEVLSQVWVEGEISGFKLHSPSGHMYFTLKDAGASVPAVMFNAYASRLRFIVKDGMYVTARCKVSLYERDGKFQLYVEDLVPMGKGSLQQQLEELKERLSKEGLFAAERKRPLVRFPKHIGVITSSGAAALQDIINVISRRYPFVKLTLFSANVQGQLAAATIINAIKSVNAREDIDEVIIARGGGSKEDLFIFNNEEIVRAAATLRVPFISAVGHEVDFTLLDFVADVRAATPSVAAEIAVPDCIELFEGMARNYEYIKAACKERIENAFRLTEEYREELLNLKSDVISANKEKLARKSEMLESLNPAAVLTRGYAGIVKGDKTVGSVKSLAAGDEVIIQFSDGRAVCDVKSVKEGNYGF